MLHAKEDEFSACVSVERTDLIDALMTIKLSIDVMEDAANATFTRNSVKATVDSLRLPTFLEFEFAAPVREEQQAIVTVLSDMDSELTALESRREKDRALKQGMMQELLTGRIRLVSAPRHSPKPSLSAETLADESTQIKNLRRQADFDKSLLLSK